MRLWLLSEMNSRLLSPSIASFPGNFKGEEIKRGSSSFSKPSGIGVPSRSFFPP